MPKKAAGKGGKAAPSKLEKKEKTLVSDMNFMMEKQKKTNETLEELKADVLALRKPLLELMEVQSEYRQPEAPMDIEEKKRRFGVFSEWIKSHSSDSFLGERFEFDVDVSEGTGVVAAKDLKQGEHFMSVPRKLMITTETFKASACGKALHGEILTTNMPSLGVAVHLAYERMDPNSFWTPYLDILPTTFTLPLLFEPEHWELLQGSPTLFDVLKIQKSTIRQYLHLYGVLKKAGHLSLPLSASLSSVGRLPSS